jgi:hypothetical protein
MADTVLVNDVAAEVAVDVLVEEGVLVVTPVFYLCA